MDRRQFLRLTGGTAAAAALAAWFAPGCGRREDPSLAPAQPAPPDPKRPLLIALVPPDQEEGGRRGMVLGGILNHGGDSVLAALAGVELICASADDAPAVAQQAVTEETWFVLVTRDGEKATARALALDAPSAAEMWSQAEGNREEAEAEARTLVERLAATLRSFLAPALTVTDVGARAADARKLYVKNPPPGAHWGRHTGCGHVFYEDVRTKEPGWMCGMAMVPELSRRFLDFYVKG